MVVLAVLLTFSLFHPTLNSPSAESSDHDEELWKVVKPLSTTTSFLNTGAHPDDERSHVVAKMSLKDGVRSGLVSANRGEGGQNVIGQELGNGLGIIRSEELIEASKVLNTDLFILSEDIDDDIYDFGFSKSIEETLEEWGEEVVYERFIRVIRQYRPEIVFTSFRNVESQHGHHRAMTVLTERAFEDAADPSVFPEHLEEGIEPWQIKKYYQPAASQEEAHISLEVGNEIDPVYGMTYAQLGEESRYLHKSQGMGNDLPVEENYFHFELVKSVNAIPDAEESIYDGIDRNFADTARRLNKSDNQIRGALKSVQRALDQVIDKYPSREQVLVSAHEAIDEVERTKDRIESKNIDPELKDDLLFKLAMKNEQLYEVSKVASSLEVEVEVDNNQLVRGADTTVAVQATNDGSTTLTDVNLQLNIPDDWALTSEENNQIELKPGESITATFDVEVGYDAEFFHPYHPAQLTASVGYQVEDTEAAFVIEPTETVAVLPDVSIEVTPDQVSINDLDIPEEIELEVHLTNYVNGPSTALPSLQVPESWEVDASENEVNFTEQGETKTVTFTISPDDDALETFTVEGSVDVNGHTFEQTVQKIDYDHINTSYYLFDAESSGKSFPLQFSEQLKVGYIESGFDQIPDYLQNMEINVEKVEDEQFTDGDLSEYDTIVLGIRAYRGRENLVEHNDRLLDYVEQGGHLVVQYHNPNDFWDKDGSAPYMLEIGWPSIEWRVTDRNAEVTVEQPDHALFNYPNEIGESDWDDWVQERGLYFPMNWDDRYETFVSMADPGEDPFTGGILMTEYGEGTYMFTNLVWYRQIQGQVPGGYRIFTNIISYPLYEE